MRYFLIVLLLVGAIVVSGCSALDTGVAPDRGAQAVLSGRSPALAFQLNAFLIAYPSIPQPFVRLDVPLGRLGMTDEDVLNIMKGASLVNATMEVEVPEWDEWLLGTVFEVEVPEWDEWLLNHTMEVEVPEWDEWLINNPLEVEVPEWDEWLINFELMDKYRSTDWMDWAVYGPYQILEVEVPEWDEWLISLTLGDMARSYDAWLKTGRAGLL
jgi:hypothetical protein